MDWEEFHHKAKGVLPSQPLPPKRYWIGVLLHDRLLTDDFQETDFVWMKAHGKITVETITDQYMLKHPDVKIDLHINNNVTPTDIVKDLNYYGDNIVIFQAREEQVRVPLPLVDRKVPQIGSPTINELRRTSPSPPVKSESKPEYNDYVEANLPPRVKVPLTPITANTRNSPGALWQLPCTESTISPLSSIATPRTPQMITMQRQDEALHNSGLNVENNPRYATIAETESKVHAYVGGGLHAPMTIKAEGDSIAPLQDPESEHLVGSFDPKDVFAKDASPYEDHEPEIRPTDVFVRRLIEEKDPELLENGMGKALAVLGDLKKLFSQYYDTSPDAEAWTKAIEKLNLQAERKRTVVGVVGNTGAGKSSVINAMLDEERLVPTNCMRACTAVVTEISWNNSNDPDSMYRAEIEFISRADWEKELHVLFKEFLDVSGTAVARDASDQNSDAGVAWSKFHAVYPKITKEAAIDCTVAGLMAKKSVLEVLGTTKMINDVRPEPFYKELQRYVDSKEKVTGKGKDKASASRMEYWPLIKVVKIYAKSPALSTGAVIVDLPGVHDSNAARAAVAQGYMKQCTGLWIVAPITRAVDDKAAKTLLGDSFKRQLKYDGGFSNVTFICSKTDDISITEATDSLELDDMISSLEDQKHAERRKRKALETRIMELTESRDVYSVAYESAVDDIEVYEDLKDMMKEGEDVYAPTKNDAKRKRAKSQNTSRKRRQTNSDSEGDFIASDEEASNSNADNESDDEGVQAPRRPLAEDEIENKLDELRQTKKNARQKKYELNAEIKEVQMQMKEAKARIVEIQSEMSAICIAGRNEYSKGAIQLDFAAGIRELDQENAAEEDEASFNPDEDLRNYDEVARSLPVFCVSSRAYQKMCGRLKKDGAVPGFKSPEETEIPQLQAHCRKLTEAGRIQTCRSFLLNFCQQLSTFSFWASNDGSGLKLNDEEKQRQANYLDKRLTELEKGLGKAVESCINLLNKEMHDQIFEKYPGVIEEAINAAPQTAYQWGAHKDEGGLFWATYKAVVRRDGAYHSKTSGFRDFNSELIDPITKRLATGWERAFQNRLPKTFELYTKDSSKILHQFHDMIEERAKQNGVGLASLASLKNQVYTYEQLFADLYTLLVTSMTEIQREANRDFTPTIVAIMSTVYDICAEERGPGSFMRMKGQMTAHVDHVRHHMFNAATETVKGHLGKMCKELQMTMETEVDRIAGAMRKDYMAVLGGVNIGEGAKTTVKEWEMRREVHQLLLGVDGQFEKVLDGKESDEEKEEEGDRMDGVVEGAKVEAGPSGETAMKDEETESFKGFNESEED